VKWIPLLFISILLFFPGCRDEQPAAHVQRISTLHEFTNSPARLVWVQDLLDNKDVHAVGYDLALMGYDSEDGKGERIILPGPENFILPFITPSGRQVVFSDYNQQQVQVVDWSGEKRHNLTKGLAVAVWRDPGDGIEWVYIARDPLKESRGATFQRLYRVQLEKPMIEELIWDKAPFGGAIQLSGDGRLFSTVIPWPDCAVIDLNRMEARRYGKGCWPALAPDLSYRFWFFDGSHRNLEMIDTRQGTRHKVNIANAPGVEGHEVYHPRWSNHPRYMVMTGPYTVRQGGNSIGGGGEGVEVYVGRFNKEYTEVEAWFRVTNNLRADFYPDLWIAKNGYVDPAGIPPEQISHQPPLLQKNLSWPVVNENLFYAWQNVAAENQWKSPAGILYHAQSIAKGMARFAVNYQMRIGTGWYLASRSPEPAPQEYAAPKSITLEFVVTRPSEQEHTDGRLLALGRENERQTLLLLDQNFLVMGIKEEGKQIQIIRLGQLPVGQSHVLLDIKPAQVTFRINTDTPKIYPRTSSDLIAWPLIMGAPGRSNYSGWSGLLDRIALYIGSLNDQEIKQAIQLVTKMKKTAKAIKPIAVKAELVSTSPIPVPEDILPYRRGLVVNEYHIVEVVQGEMEDKDILVAHWAILDGKILPEAERTVGKIYELHLDAFDNRPELEGERLSMESDNLLLTMYYDLDS
jgi:hypothetical protein